MDVMMDEYSATQTDQLTEVFNRALDYAGSRKLDSRGDFALTALREVIGDLEAQRAIWHPIWEKYNNYLTRIRQIPLGEEVINDGGRGRC